MIPKIIHLCWFGKGEYPLEMLTCLDSIKVFLPDYEIIIWNEDNFDINTYRFSMEAYQEKKYAFVSDVCRLYALNKYGGIYLDTDVEILKNLDAFLIHDFFCGFESDKLISTALLGSIKTNPVLESFLNMYKSKSFYRKHLYKKYYTTPNTITITKDFVKRGLKLNNKRQKLETAGIVIYPQRFFSPKDSKTGELSITSDTHTIHHFSGSWIQGKNLKNWVKRWI